MTNRTLHQRIDFLIDANMEGRGAGLLTSVSQDNRPHAAWIGTLCRPSLERIVTMTSPDSRKVCNILNNPHVEWLFSDENMTELVYLRGTAKVLDDMALVRKAWNAMPDKSRAYFLPYQKVGMTFLILETYVNSIEYRLPAEDRSWFFSPDDFNDVSSGPH